MLSGRVRSALRHLRPALRGVPADVRDSGMPAAAWLLPPSRAAATTTEEVQARARAASEAKRKAAEAEANGTMFIFDRAVKSAQRDRAAWKMSGKDDQLQGEVTERLLDRLEDCTRKFADALVLGGALVSVASRLVGNRAGLQRVTYLDLSSAQLEAARQASGRAASASGKPAPESTFVVGDEEKLPFEPASFDVVISSLGLHWANDLPGAIAQARKVLRPDGLFLCAILGGGSLNELRISCAVAEQERDGGISARVSPLAHVRDAGNLLTRAGFALPTVDTDTITLYYPSALDVVDHLRNMGETNAQLSRRGFVRRDTALATAAAYESLFSEESEDGEVGVPATFQVIFMTGWAPHPSQSRPKERGSASASFQDIARELGAPEAGASDAAAAPGAAASGGSCGGGGAQKQASGGSSGGGGGCGSGGCSSAR